MDNLDFEDLCYTSEEDCVPTTQIRDIASCVPLHKVVSRIPGAGVGIVTEKMIGAYQEIFHLSEPVLRILYAFFF